MKTQEPTILTTYSKPIDSVGEPGATARLKVLKEETWAWYRLYCAENSFRPEISARRWFQIEGELSRTGTYWQSAEELEYGAKVAWRNSTRCIGRLHWQNLVVRDCRALRSAEEMISIFAPEHSDQRLVRIWNRQLIGYAGHRQSDGSILGDPLNVPFTEVVRKLGWTRNPAGPFDLLPLLIETSEGLRWFDWPEGLILEVPIRHPDHPWFEELGLKLFALPAVSGMLLQIGGVKYPAAPFSGWYVGNRSGKETGDGSSDLHVSVVV
jgi:nitric-oxide synthase